jgi:hydroxylamine reductase
MSMFCYQCQETARNTGCTVRGVCGKDETTANLQDVLVYSLKGLSLAAKRKKDAGMSITEEAAFIMKGLFVTITNANFDPERITSLIREALKKKISSSIVFRLLALSIRSKHGLTAQEMLCWTK